MSRRGIDKTTVYEGLQGLPEQRTIEEARSKVVAAEEPSMVQVQAEPYLPSDKLIDAVNLAIALGRPLLLQGDPGCGKTRLAYSVAYELGMPLEECYIKSTSKAQDFLYTYDAMNRLYDAQLGDPRAKDIRNYIQLGPLGRAIVRAGFGRRSVVLIDEIDKADLDFPNDLLLEFDRLTFQVNEVEDMRFTVPEDRPELRPIVFVTHNEEKALPTAFLRRCIYFYLEMPKEEKQLLDILDVHGHTDGNFNRRAIDVLKRLQQSGISKKPGISELLDWVGYAEYKNISEEELEQLPYVEALVKQKSDLDRAMKVFGSDGNG